MSDLTQYFDGKPFDANKAAAEKPTKPTATKPAKPEPEATATPAQATIEERTIEGIFKYGKVSDAIKFGLDHGHFSNPLLGKLWNGCVEKFKATGEADLFEVVLTLKDSGKIKADESARLIELDSLPDYQSTGIHVSALVAEVIAASKRRRADYLMQRAGRHLADGATAKAADLYIKAAELLAGAKTVSKGSASKLWDAIPSYSDEIPLVDLNKEPEPAADRVFLKGISIGRDGDIIAVSARLKSFKTSILNALLAASVGGDGVDLLGFTVKSDGVGLLFDTEQSEDEILWQAKSMRRRLGVKEMPARLKVVGLRDYIPSMRLAIIKQTIEDHLACGISLIIIDGVADLGGSVNDDENAARLVNFITVAASRAQCPLFPAIHLNHSDRDAQGGGRGHLGKELERKAKTVLCIDKDGEGVGTIYFDTARKKTLPLKHGQRIHYCEEKQMVVSLNQTPAEIRDEANKEVWESTLREVIARTGMLAWHRDALIEEILEVERLAAGKQKNATKKTGNNRINSMLNAGFLKHDSEKGILTSTLKAEKKEEIDDEEGF